MKRMDEDQDVEFSFDGTFEEVPQGDFGEPGEGASEKRLANPVDLVDGLRPRPTPDPSDDWSDLFDDGDDGELNVSGVSERAHEVFEAFVPRSASEGGFVDTAEDAAPSSSPEDSDRSGLVTVVGSLNTSDGSAVEYFDTVDVSLALTQLCNEAESKNKALDPRLVISLLAPEVIENRNKDMSPLLTPRLYAVLRARVEWELQRMEDRGQATIAPALAARIMELMPPDASEIGHMKRPSLKAILSL